MHREQNVVSDIARSRGLTIEQVNREVERLADDHLLRRHVDQEGVSWCCATQTAVEAITEAYRERHPMTTAQPDQPE